MFLGLGVEGFWFQGFCWAWGFWVEWLQHCFWMFRGFDLRRGLRVWVFLVSGPTLLSVGGAPTKQWERLIHDTSKKVARLGTPQTASSTHCLLKLASAVSACHAQFPRNEGDGALVHGNISVRVKDK